MSVRTLGVGISLVAGLLGCGDGGEPAAPAPEAGNSPAEVKAEKPSQSSDKPGGQTSTQISSAVPAEYRVPFTEAAITDDVPEGSQLPPPLTMGQRSTAKLRLGVEQVWASVHVADPTTGEPLPLKVNVSTAEGDFEITLDPKLAPNHVRNFLALAKVHYFDGLAFERTVRQTSEANSSEDAEPFEMVTFGCPMGLAETGRGHLGYFMLPEFSEKAKHAEGTVGFWREESPASAGTRMYITLGPAPVLDGNFTVIGKVTKGLGVVQKIHRAPTMSDDPASIASEIPRLPTLIRGTTVYGQPGDLAVVSDGSVK